MKNLSLHIVLLTTCVIFWTGFFFLQDLDEKKAEAFQGKNLKIFQLDVGQGDATLIVTPDSKVTVIDAGPIYRRHGVSMDSGKEILGPFLRELKITHIDHLILTHHDLDHVGGALWLLENFSVGRIYDNGRKEATEIYRELMGMIQAMKIPYQILKRGDCIHLGGEVVAHVLGPAYENEFDGNDQSIVMKIIYGRLEFLTTGDIEGRAERDLCLLYGRGLDSDILKSPHHGSKTSSTTPFLSYVCPSTVSISVGRNNSYGHPAPGVMDRYQKSDSCRIFRTDQDGSIFFMSNGVECYGATQRNGEVLPIQI